MKYNENRYNNELEELEERLGIDTIKIERINAMKFDKSAE